jgi:hypothetical protein
METRESGASSDAAMTALGQVLARLEMLDLDSLTSRDARIAQSCMLEIQSYLEPVDLSGLQSVIERIPIAASLAGANSTRGEPTDAQLPSAGRSESNATRPSPMDLLVDTRAQIVAAIDRHGPRPSP